MDNAVADVMFEGAETGGDLSSQGYLLPEVGQENGYNSFLTPENMPASCVRYSYNYGIVHKMRR